MRNPIAFTLISFLAIIGLISAVQAEMASKDEALTVAKNWVTLITQKEGKWGGSETADVEGIQEFKRGERVLGYFCRVRPKGFIVISLRKELEPIKAYSPTCDLDPESDEEMADVIKIGMERVLNTIERQIAPVNLVKTEAMKSILKINYCQSWKELERKANVFKRGSETGELKFNYEEGQILLSSCWHQRDPYNRQCPTGYNGCTEPHCVVGCVATAASQILRYWSWPPWGEGNDGDVTYNDSYDWRNMPPMLGSFSDPAEIDAVAELCHEVGVAAHMDYCIGGEGPCQSGAYHTDVKNAYKDHFRYSEDLLRIRYRKNFNNPEDWFDSLKTELDKNRPVQYGIKKHSIVADGWRKIYIEGELTLQYHMNYGGSVGPNWWYTLDQLIHPEGGGPEDEDMILGICPAPALGHWLSGTYGRGSFPYRYFDRDAVNFFGVEVDFQSGQYLQFLPNVKVICGGYLGNPIRFDGAGGTLWFFYNTRLFTRGDVRKGVRILNGTVKLNPHGSIKFY
jgi:hypothetical protein